MGGDAQVTARTILFVGRPGSGKETQARLLAAKTGFPIFSTGEKFRELREHRDELGQRIKDMYDTGKLMPDWFAEYLFEDAILKLSHTTGIILEGSGRVVGEAERIHKILTWLERPYRVVNLVISPEEAIRRQLVRAQIKNRPESNTEEKIRVRLAEFDANTAPAIEFFKQKDVMVEIDGERSIEAVHSDIMSQFGSF